MVRPDGQSVSVATSYLVEDDRILEHGQRPKAQRLHAPQPAGEPDCTEGRCLYPHISVQGGTTQCTDDPDFLDIERLSRGERMPVDDR